MTSTVSNKKPLPLLALALLPAFFLLQNYNELLGFIETRQIILYAVSMYVLMAIGYFVFRKRKMAPGKAMLMLFTISVFFLFFTPIHDFIDHITFNRIFGNFWISFSFLCLVTMVLVGKIIRLRTVPAKLVQLLNLTMVVLLAYSIVTLMLNKARAKKDNNLIYPEKTISGQYRPLDLSDSSKPDIYFLLFDEYTNNQTLNRIWKFDNRPVTDWLRAKGFHVPDSTSANYNFTLFSLSSIFNMNYLDSSAGSDGTILSNLIRANQSLSDNETFSILQKENYSIDFLAPFSNKIEENGLGHFFDYLINRQMFLQTLPGNVFQRIDWRMRSSHAKISEDAFYRELLTKSQLIGRTVDEIENSTDSNNNRRPHFVYGHLMITHIPYVFDSLGQVMSAPEAERINLFQAYPNQVEHANEVIKDLVQYIQAHNKKNTLIIILGDHGFRHFEPSRMAANSFGNFSAFYFPDGNYTTLFGYVSPVNVFRIIFNKYFGQELPLLKDSCINVKDQL